MKYSGHCRLIASDADLTFTDRAKNAVPENMETIQEARKRGIPFIFATGRGWSGVRKWADDMKLTAPQVLNNGAEILLPQSRESVFQDAMPRTLTEFLYRGFMAEKFLPVLFSGADMVGEAVDEETFQRLRTNQEPYEVWSLERMEKELFDHVSKIAIISVSRESEMVALTSRLSAQAEAKGLGRCVCKMTEKGIMTICPAGATKLQGIARVCQMLGCRLEDVVAFGDGDNDAEMLAGVGMGIAMANATPATLAAADVVTADCDEAGLAKGLRKFVLDI